MSRIQSIAISTDWWIDQITVKLRSIEYLEQDSEQQSVHQLIQSHAFFIMIEGEALLEIDQERIEVGKDMAISCMPGQTMGLLQASEDFKGYVFFFGLFVEDKNHSLQLSENICLFSNEHRLTISEKVAILCHKLYQEWKSDESLCKFRCQIDFQEMMFLIIAHSSIEKEKMYLSLVGVKQYIEANYKKDITIQQLAKLVKLSPKYFADLFKKKFGKTVMDYVSELRLQAAKCYMHKGKMKIREIAHEVGYTDEFYFSRKFKKEIGLTPSNYMKNSKRRIVAYSTNVLGHLLPMNLIPYAAPLHPKWTSYYYQYFRREIPVHLSAYRIDEDWQKNITCLESFDADIIIASDTIQACEREELEQLGRIIYIPSKMTSWKDQFLYTANQLQETWSAEQWLQSYELKVEEAREKLHQSNENNRIAVVRMVGNQLYLQSNDRLVDFLFKDLQLSPACSLKVADYQQVSLDDLYALRADCLFILIRQDNLTRSYWRALQKEDRWKRLHAVQRQNVKIITSDPWLENSPHAYLRKLEQMMS
ncbi:AraC family transcriptional regulator [Bacillus sp. Bva_UNVM-123]|uniref:AraC family transcriptional regulator n=1 Tax=Bacillus sp. Bva_UNVM-123 TaxID=2829798 RepID=UPI00391FA1C3